MQEINFNAKLEQKIEMLATYLRISFDEATQILCAYAVGNTFGQAQMHNIYKSINNSRRMNLIDMYINGGYQIVPII